MKGRSSGFIRLALLLVVLVGAIGLQSAGKSPLSTHDKAYYASENLINFVRPGLVFKITSAQIAQDGTISARVKVTDPMGLGLDRLGVNTPGPISISFVVATIPNGQTQYTAYTTRSSTSPITKVTAIQAGADSGGTFTTNSDGDYTYMFKTKAPTGFDASATHTIGVYGSRNLADFGFSNDTASDTFNFVPNGGAVTVVRDVVRDVACNRCHDRLSFHGGSRVGAAMCVLCHTPQTSDPDTGNTVNFPVMIHKIHYGAGLPTVRAGKPYQIIGFNQAVSDFSNVVFPADSGMNIGKNFVTGDPIVNGGVRRCEVCHDQKSGATHADAYLTNPTRAACGACHDTTNFVTGENHVNLPQVDDNQCKMCHNPQGELENDASIKGAHVIATESSQLPGMNLNILKVDNGTAGSKPTVTFSIKDNAGNPIPASSLTVSPNRLGLVLAGPTSDYGYVNFGPDVLTGGYVSENGTTASCGQDGVCTYTFAHAIPADAKGTFSIGIEGRRGAVLNPGTTKEIKNVEYGAKNVVFNFSVDGSPIQARRTIVALKNCNQCHEKLSLHGENRNQIEMCVLCHNPSETDATMRPLAKDPADKNGPPQGVNFTMLIHKIHTGEDQANAMGRPFEIIAFGGTKVNFNDVVFPAMNKSGATGDVKKCFLCHVGNSQEDLPTSMNTVRDPRGILNPTAPAVTSACTACHNVKTSVSHALANTTQLGESCEACHSSNSEFAPNKVHAE